MSSTQRRLIVVTVAIILTAFIMRSPIVAIAPVIGQVRADLGISATVAGLLTSIPVLCFAVATPFAVWVVRRGGTTFAVTLCLVGTTVGWILRSSGGIETAIIGTVLIGVFITIGNVVVPVVIRREYSVERAGFMTGIYVSALNVGSMAVTIGTAPLEPTWGWRGAVLVWAVLGVAALAVWCGLHGWRATVTPRESASSIRDAGHIPPRLFRSLTVWFLAIAFSGQAFSYYGITAWLPQLLAEEQGYSATQSGAISSIFQISAIIGAIGAPVIARRFSNTASIATIGVLWLAIPLGFLLAPDLWALWCVLGGAAQGGGITIVLITTVSISQDDRHASAMNGLVQGAGYSVAALSPTLVGALRDVSGAWTAPLLAILVATLAFGIFGTWGAVRAKSRV
jgi:CP family cyanate transporter-like MFS transporter